jgi:hypothetical protein
VSEAIPEGAASDPDPSGGLGAGDDGGAPSTGSVADGGDSFAAERAKLEAQSRRLQSERDRLAVELDRARATDTATGSEGADTGLTLAEFRAEMRRATELQSSVSSLKAEYPYANPDLFARVDSYDSVEQFVGDVQASHQHVAAMIQPAVDAGISKVRADYEAKFGPIASSSPSATEDGSPSGLPESVAAYQALTWSEQDMIDKQHPGLLERLMTKALQ